MVFGHHILETGGVAFAALTRVLYGNLDASTLRRTNYTVVPIVQVGRQVGRQTDYTRHPLPIGVRDGRLTVVPVTKLSPHKNTDGPGTSQHIVWETPALVSRREYIVGIRRAITGSKLDSRELLRHLGCRQGL